MLTALVEATDPVVDARRLKTLRDLGSRTRDARTVDEAVAEAVRVLAENTGDLPFCRVLLRGREGEGSLGLPLDRVAATGRAELLYEVPAGLEREGAIATFLAPLPSMDGGAPLGWLALGVSERRPFDDGYHGFLELVVTGLGSALARAQAAHAGSAERRRLSTLLNHIPAAINFLRGPDFVVELLHPQAAALLGGREVVGKPLLEAFPEFRDQPHYERMRRVYETGVPDVQREVHTWVVVDGRKIEQYWDSANIPVRDPSGRIEGVMTYEHEVTATVLGRRQLEVADRAKDEFLAMMSHELRTPLNAILGWASLLGNTRDEDKIARGIEVIARNARAQERIVNDLLDVSRIISGKLQLTLRRTDIATVIAAAADVVRPAAEAKDIRLVLDLAPDVGEAVADADRLQQIVWNLLSNAVRFTPRGGSISVLAERADGGLRIRVDDTGAGIPREHLQHVFERFRQVDSSTTRAHKGLGLGLAIVRHLVEAHGGHVEAHSEGPGRGAAFTVHLPIRAVSAPRAPAEGDTNPGLDATPRAPEAEVSLKDVRVLLVDDDADSLEVLRVVLSDAGAVVTSTRSAREALDAGGPFDVIVSDIGMPEMDGYTFMQHIRSRGAPASPGEPPSPPAIALTAFARPQDVEWAQRAGFQEHLKKPVEPHQLLATVKAWTSP